MSTRSILPGLAAFVAGAMNSVAGGGSFLSFPALVFAGVPPISANATNNAAMWVGTIGSARGYREEVAEHRGLLLPVIAVSIAGSLIGACLLLFTPPASLRTADSVAAALCDDRLCAEPSPDARCGRDAAARAVADRRAVLRRDLRRLLRRGMGILMLAVLAFSGLPSFNAQNAIKNVLSVAINGVALIPFVIARIVDWRFALPMAVIALAGGYLGARFFRRVPQPVARAIVVVIGVTMTIVFFVRTFV